MKIDAWNIGVVNWIFYVLLLLISLLIGIYLYIIHQREIEAESQVFQKTNYLMLGNRNMHFVPISLSLMGTFFSGISILGIPEEFYLFGITYALICFGHIIMAVVAIFFFIPVFYNLRLPSCYEYLGLRFSKSVEFVCSILFIMQTEFYLGIVLYCPSLLFNKGGATMWVMIIVMCAICIVYTVMGGLVTSVWTSTIQVAVIYLGLVALIICGLKMTDGWGNLFRVASEGGRMNVDFSPDPRQRNTFFSMIIGGSVLWISVYCTSHSSIQRLNSNRSLREAQLSFAANVVLIIVFLLALMLCGSLIFFKYRNCDIHINKTITKREELLASLAFEVMNKYPGVFGLFILCIYGGNLCTLSAGFNSMATVTIRNVLPVIYSSLSDNNAYKALNVFTIVYGVVALWCAFLTSLSYHILRLAVTAFGVICGPILGVFTLGMFFPIGNYKGALAGHAVSQIFILWIFIGNMNSQIIYPTLDRNISDCSNQTNITYINIKYIHRLDGRPMSALDQFYSISYFWYAFIGWIVTLIVGIPISYITRNSITAGRPEMQFITPLLREFWKDYLSPNTKHSIQYNQDSISESKESSLKGKPDVKNYHHFLKISDHFNK